MSSRFLCVGYKTSRLSSRGNIHVYYYGIDHALAVDNLFVKMSLFSFPRSKQSVSITFVSVTNFQSFSVHIYFCAFFLFSL